MIIFLYSVVKLNDVDYILLDLGLSNQMANSRTQLGDQPKTRHLSLFFFLYSKVMKKPLLRTWELCRMTLKLWLRPQISNIQTYDVAELDKTKVMSPSSTTPTIFISTIIIRQLWLLLLTELLHSRKVIRVQDDDVVQPRFVRLKKKKKANNGSCYWLSWLLRSFFSFMFFLMNSYGY